MDAPDKTLSEGKLIQAILRRIVREVDKLRHHANHIQCPNPTEHANLERSTIDEQGLTTSQAAQLKQLVAGEEMAALCQKAATQIVCGARREISRAFVASAAERFTKGVASRLVTKCGVQAACRAIRLYEALEELRRQAGAFNGGIAVESVMAAKSSPALVCHQLLHMLGSKEELTNNQARKTVYGLKLLAGFNPED